MKEFFKQIPNRIKSIYYLWCLLHLFLLFVIGDGLIDTSSGKWMLVYNHNFFPFDTTFWNGYRAYDYSEFIIYTISPIIIGYAIYLWKKK